MRPYRPLTWQTREAGHPRHATTPYSPINKHKAPVFQSHSLNIEYTINAIRRNRRHSHVFLTFTSLLARVPTIKDPARQTNNNILIVITTLKINNHNKLNKSPLYFTLIKQMQHAINQNITKHFTSKDHLRK